MYIRVEAKPGSRRESVMHVDDKTLAIAVKEEAKGNMANARIRELVAEEFRVPVGKVKMISGHRSPRKIFDIDL